MGGTEAIKILKKAIQKNGETKQLIKLIEEQAELIQALCKYLYEDGEKEKLSKIEDITEETADVMVTINEMNLIMSEKLNREFSDDVCDQVEYKINRLNKRMGDTNEK